MNLRCLLWGCSSRSVWYPTCRWLSIIAGSSNTKNIRCKIRYTLANSTSNPPPNSWKKMKYPISHLDRNTHPQAPPRERTGRHRWLQLLWRHSQRVLPGFPRYHSFSIVYRGRVQHHLWSRHLRKRSKPRCDSGSPRKRRYNCVNDFSFTTFIIDPDASAIYTHSSRIKMER